MRFFNRNVTGALALIGFIGYVIHVIAGKVSVVQFSRLSFEERAGKINRFADPAGLSDPMAALLLFTTAVLFTITMLQREAHSGKRNAKQEP